MSRAFAVAATLRGYETQALLTLLALHGQDGPDDWQPEHWEAAEAAAMVLAGWERRTAKLDEQKAAAKAKHPARRNSADAKRKPYRDPIPPAERAKVLQRSGGRCEADIFGVCERQANHVHHKGGRIGREANTAPMLLHVCAFCHVYIHDHPEISYEQGWLVRRLGVVS